MLAVFVRAFNDLGNTYQSYTIEGKWVHHLVRAAQFIVPSVGASQEDLDRISPYLPSSAQEGLELLALRKVRDFDVPRAAAIPVLDKMRSIEEEAQNVYRQHTSVLDSAHALLAHDTDLRFGSLDKIAQRLLRLEEHQITPATLYAVRKALIDRNIGFGIDPYTHRYSGIFIIQPKQSVNNIRTVSQWIREYQDEKAHEAVQKLHHVTSMQPSRPGVAKVKSFLEMATSLIRKSRRARDVHGAWTGPHKRGMIADAPSGSMRLMKTVSFSESDEAIVNFIKSDCMNVDYGHLPRHQSLISTIVRATGMYDDLVERDQAWSNMISNEIQYLFLQEIGAIMPFENRHLRNAHLLLPGTGRSKPLERLHESLQVVRKDKEFADSMADLRHDWKDVPVFCIDSDYAQNIDDGVSVEHLPKTDGEKWIRIHIANPTARVRKDHDMARMAAHLTETFYAPDAHHWMLPLWASQRYFSLAPDRAVLTFSARFDKLGNILETQVQPGIIRNVIKLSPSALRRLLDGVCPDRRPTVWFGKPRGIDLMPMEQDHPNISEQQLDDLKALYALARARARLRTANCADDAYNHCSISVDYSFGMKNEPRNLCELSIPRNGAYTLRGDPAIGLTPFPWDELRPQASRMTSDSLVKELMFLAGEIAATWCAERNVPVLYRATRPDNDEAQIALVKGFYREYVRPAVVESGFVPKHWLDYTKFMHGVTETSLTPGPQSNIGLPCYAKVSTPIGRYGDMINHWQIESVLREEARAGKSLVGSLDDQYLAFSRAELSSIMLRLVSREDVMSRVMRASETFWISLFCHRALHEGMVDLPETFTCFLVKPLSRFDRGLFMGIIKELGLTQVIELPIEGHIPKGANIDLWGRAGDIWEVKLVSSQPYHPTIQWEPTRLLHRDEHSIEELERRAGLRK